MLAQELLAPAFRQQVRIGIVVRCQPLEHGNRAFQLQQRKGVSWVGVLHRQQHRLQDERIAGRRDREGGVVVVDMEGALVEDEPQLAAFQDVAELIAQHRHQHLVAQLVLERPPVDIEEGGIFGRAAVFEHVLPPGVGAAADAHVVGNDIEDEAHSMRVELGAECVERRPAAELVIDTRGIDHVVAMHAAAGRCPDGRGIEVGDTQARQIGHDLARGREREVRVELHAIGRTRRRRGRLQHAVRQRSIALRNSGHVRPFARNEVSGALETPTLEMNNVYWETI